MLGVFAQADAWEGTPESPQTLNTYAYTLGNPLKYRDPTGRFPIGSDDWRINFENMNNQLAAQPMTTLERQNYTIENQFKSAQSDAAGERKADIAAAGASFLGPFGATATIGWMLSKAVVDLVSPPGPFPSSPLGPPILQGGMGSSTAAVISKVDDILAASAKSTYAGPTRLLPKISATTEESIFASANAKLGHGGGTMAGAGLTSHAVGSKNPVRPPDPFYQSFLSNKESITAANANNLIRTMIDQGVVQPMARLKQGTSVVNIRLSDQYGFSFNAIAGQFRRFLNPFVPPPKPPAP